MARLSRSRSLLEDCSNWRLSGKSGCGTEGWQRATVRKTEASTSNTFIFRGSLKNWWGYGPSFVIYRLIFDNVSVPDKLLIY